MRTCREVMTPDPCFCLPHTNLVEIAKLMRSKNIGPVPVVEDEDDHVLTGIVTDRDLIIKALAEGRDALATTAFQVMTPHPVTCKPDDNISTAIELMEAHQIRRIPVVDDQGKLVGIIAQGDIALRLNKSKRAGELLEELSKPEMLARELRRKAG